MDPLLESAEACAAASRRCANLDGDERPDFAAIAHSEDVDVEYVAARELSRQRARAHRGRDGARHRIAINQELSTAEKQSLGAHELGHLRAQVERMRLGRAEHRFAWLYAGALLVPIEPLSRLWRRTRSLDDVLAYWSHLPPEFVALRARDVVTDLWIVEYYEVQHLRPNEHLDRDFKARIVGAAVSAISNRTALFDGVEALRLPGSARKAAVFIR